MEKDGVIMDDGFIFMVLETVAEVPKGKVASYSQIASLLGYPRHARQVGRVLASATQYGKYPCHRIVHADGTLLTHWKQQEVLLSEEGIFVEKGKVDMQKYGWRE
ncbi:MAG: MGMT family protein [Breznakia sp.]